MNIEQAQQLRKRLLYLEGLIAWKTREYIWKVIIGPEAPQHRDHFLDLVNPSVPFNPLPILQFFRREELSVYFFLKLNGNLICQGYSEFLSANDVRVGDAAHSPASFLVAD